ncbi:MAG: TetR family transcriptional regulator [Bdellovibrio sp. CG12_big_fil_rev_8_21_14_0_65_39_13]|nr:MAG: TetR family transcriptional regulator [Bdellovibrio sp. CG22_combo_CG10-13_8_21_14_all_39_27]PIQ60278.1 MAG: TetR family transcriptional regulator [Bdellovibrio sp. CG12_big_fil_rev_8_21_14_0_65_39_13]PIR34714.1 MAG: TetR family transcriptional regulator [Bdellovibrio sp. CG11_big_fil_rev_8_21_14_0_20_39_38]PJB53314.1 MAG: TetR family transcriptional regulator [Bdellovibrio sp. CG_4_9_14_3_um_filter_39_7]
MSKGQLTKDQILLTALEFSSKFGFEALSIGKLAEAVGLSKSGLFGHFKSKEKLQEMILDYTADSFTFKVFLPATKMPRGIPRIDAILENWVKWTKNLMKGGCPLLTAAIEFDDRPGEIRNKVRDLYRQKMDFFKKAAVIAVTEGQFKRDSDPEQFAYEFYSLMAGYHINSRLLDDKKAEQKLKTAYQKLINDYKV